MLGTPLHVINELQRASTSRMSFHISVSEVKEESSFLTAKVKALFCGLLRREGFLQRGIRALQGVHFVLFA